MIFEKLGEVIDAQKYARGLHGRVKATIHKSGFLGFSGEAAKVMGLAKGRRLLVATGGAEWYAKVVADDVRGYPLRCSSGYYIVDMRMYFDKLGVDYSDRRKSIIFDISACGVDEADGATIWRMDRREHKSRRKEEGL